MLMTYTPNILGEYYIYEVSLIYVNTGFNVNILFGVNIIENENILPIMHF